MGSAVSAVSGAVGGLVGSVSGGVGGILGQGIQGITSNVIPGAQLADPERMKEAINQLQALRAKYGSAFDAAQGMTQQAYGGAQQGLGTSQDALSLIRNQASGQAPTAAQGILQQGKDQAIASQQAIANSGNLSQMLGGQKTAMDNAANLTQQAANQAAQLRAQEIAMGQQNYANAANTNASNANALFGSSATNQSNLGSLAGSAATNAGNIAVGQAGQQQGALNQAQGQQAQAAGGMLNGMGSMMAGMMMSDEDQKSNIQSDRAKGISNYFKSQNQPKAESDNSSQGMSSYGDKDNNNTDETPRQKAARQIKEGFISDKDTKKDIRKSSMLHRFLEKIEPVTFEYKEPTGEMGKTPGVHMGIIAQDVEKAPGGKSMIKETPEGKAIDMASAMGMLMSAAADAHERMSSLEELFKSKKAK